MAGVSGQDNSAESSQPPHNHAGYLTDTQRLLNKSAEDTDHQGRGPAGVGWTHGSQSHAMAMWAGLCHWSQRVPRGVQFRLLQHRVRAGNASPCWQPFPPTAGPAVSASGLQHPSAQASFPQGGPGALGEGHLLATSHGTTACSQHQGVLFSHRTVSWG